LTHPTTASQPTSVHLHYTFFIILSISPASLAHLHTVTESLLIPLSQTPSTHQLIILHTPLHSAHITVLPLQFTTYVIFPHQPPTIYHIHPTHIHSFFIFPQCVFLQLNISASHATTSYNAPLNRWRHPAQVSAPRKPFQSSYCTTRTRIGDAINVLRHVSQILLNLFHHGNAHNAFLTRTTTPHMHNQLIAHSTIALTISDTYHAVLQLAQAIYKSAQYQPCQRRRPRQPLYTALALPPPSPPGPTAPFTPLSQIKL